VINFQLFQTKEKAKMAINAYAKNLRGVRAKNPESIPSSIMFKTIPRNKSAKFLIFPIEAATSSGMAGRTQGEIMDMTPSKNAVMIWNILNHSIREYFPRYRLNCEPNIVVVLDSGNIK